MSLLDFHKSVRLGKQKAIPSKLKLSSYLTDVLPPPPAQIDYTKGQLSFGMMLNNQLGCCTIAAVGHATQIFTSNTSGTMVTVPDSTILRYYEEWDGYKPSDPSTDQGGVEVNVLNDWQKDSFSGRKLDAHASLNALNIVHVCKAIELFGGVYIGVQLPLSCQGKTTWDVGTGYTGVPGSWGGHAVFVPKYRTNENGQIIFSAISWGGLYDITQAFWSYNNPTNGAYLDEVHVLIAADWLPKGYSPEGVSLGMLLSDAKIVAE